jgi:hypothetical protein
VGQVKLLKTASGTTQEHNESADSACFAAMGVGTTTAPTGSTVLSVVGDVTPVTGGTGNVGTAAKKFASVHATEVVSGDIGFTDPTCLKCGRPFDVGDTVLFEIVSKRPGGQDTVFLAQPKHSNCRRAVAKAKTVKLAAKRVAKVTVKSDKTSKRKARA